VLGQLGNRVQHALRAYTPRDQKAVRAAAETFVPNPKVDVARAIGELAVGEALVSMLLDKGVPMPVERALIAPPRARMGAITPEERAAVRARSPVGAKYDAAVNRESAYEVLNRRVAEARLPPEARTGDVPAPAPKPTEEPRSKMDDFLWGNKRRQGVVEAAAKSATRSVASGLGRGIVRGILGSLFGGRRR
jgi:hypothetical protein